MNFNNTVVSGGSSVSNINGRLIINGKEYPSMPQGRSLRVDQTGVYVDGKKVEPDGSSSSWEPSDQVVKIEIHGNVDGPIRCNGDVIVSGTVTGNIHAGSTIKCGDVMGTVESGTDLRCNNIGASATSGTDMNVKVEGAGNASAGTSLDVGGSISGSANAGTSLTAGGHIQGRVDAGISVNCCTQSKRNKQRH